jgi:colicin import membrane protein
MLASCAVDADGFSAWGTRLLLAISMFYPSFRVRSDRMARKLRTYQTSLGFFDLAIAAPSMKAALEAWGSNSNLFHQGFAKETTDPAVVAATIARPGIILRRPVGTNGAFTEQAVFPTNLSGGAEKKASSKPRSKVQEAPHPKFREMAVRESTPDLERERKRIEAERRKADAAREREARRRDREIAKMEAAFEDAKKGHERTTKEIESDRAAVDRRARAEATRWEKQKEQLEAMLRQMRE